VTDVLGGGGFCLDAVILVLKESKRLSDITLTSLDPRFMSANYIKTFRHLLTSAKFVNSSRHVQGSHASWKVLDFFLEDSRTWKVLEKHFGPGKSWKNIRKITHFFIGSNGKQAEIVNVPVCVDFYFYLSS